MIAKDVIYALRNYDMCKTAHDEAMAKCEVSWGYFGHRYISALEKAEEQLDAALIDLIDSRVKLIMRGDE